MPKRYKKPVEETKVKEKDESPVPVKKVKIKSSKPLFKGLSDNLQRWKIVPLTGLFLILFSFCILIAFTSFIFTWKADYASNIKQSANWLGALGRELSDFFYQRRFWCCLFWFYSDYFSAWHKIADETRNTSFRQNIPDYTFPDDMGFGLPRILFSFRRPCFFRRRGRTALF